MKFLATATRSIRNPYTGRVSTVIKGQVYGKAQAKPFMKNGKVPDFFVDGNLSYFERAQPGRLEFLKAHDYESDVFLSIYKGIIAFFNGDTKALRAFAKYGGTVQMAFRMEREYAQLLGIDYVELPHEANDPLASTEHVFNGLYPCSENQESMIIDLTLAELSQRY